MRQCSILSTDASANTFADATSNKNHAVGGGNSVLSVDGRIGQARRLNGNGRPIVIPDAPSLRLPGDFSAGLWLAADTTATWKIWRYMLSKGDGTANNSNYHILFYEDSLSKEIVGGYHDGSAPSSQCEVPAFPWRDGAWHFVQLVKKNGDIVLYLDGEARARTTGASMAITSNADVKIGSDYLEQCVFTGSIDEVRISAVAHGPAWIKLCYENQRADQNVVKVHQ